MKKRFYYFYADTVIPFCQKLDKMIFKLKLRKRALVAAVTCRNFILIYEIKETCKNNKPGREYKLLRRTDYTMESDFKTMKGAIMQNFPVSEFED